MAVITRIEIVNYLGEGWEPSMGVDRWTPLWPANTIRLSGQSTAIQVPNGSGKTSVTSAILYLLSRDKQLKREFLERCAPAEKGSHTHVRIEFAIRTDENLLQRDLMTLDPQDIPAKTYVIGVCASRGGDEPQFYRHQGVLEDAPAYLQEGTRIVYPRLDQFRATGKKLTSWDWNKWSTIAEWSKAVGEFMSPEVVRQNVQFHKSGAGDASATFKKLVVDAGQRFDAAYFQQVAAPQLLANMMGDSAEEDERSVEDTITISMTRFIDAKLKVERKKEFLDRRDILQKEFAPVLEAAGVIEVEQVSYQRQLQELAKDASFLDRFAGSGDSSLSGVPRDLGVLRIGTEAKQCLAGMALDKDGSVVISDEALASALGQSTSHLNQLADRSTAVRSAVFAAATSAQVIDFKRDIKFSEGYGGRRKAVRYYDRTAALELARRRPMGEDEKLLATLREAFDTAEQFVDTNPFRKEHRRLLSRQAELKRSIAQAQQTGLDAEKREGELQKQVTERAENQAAYQEFCTHAELLPEELRSAPRAADEWLERETGTRDSAINAHNLRVGQLTAGWEKLSTLRAGLGFQTLAERLEELVAQKEQLDTQEQDADVLRQKAEEDWDRKKSDVSQTEKELAGVQKELDALRDLVPGDAAFRCLFGEVDPCEMEPPTDELKELQVKFRAKSKLREPKESLLNQMTALQSGEVRFRALFGDIDPRKVSPRKDLEVLTHQHHLAELAYGQHHPLAEALEQHMELHSVDPQAWMDEADLARSDAQARALAAKARGALLSQEIAALDDLSLVDDTEYAAALRALSAAKVPHGRLRDVLLEAEPDKKRCLSLLAAFGAILSAPVVEGLVDANAAMEALAAGRHNVPIMLRDALLQAIRANPATALESGAALGFIAGPRTRRIQAIVDPRALEDEREELLKRLSNEELAIGKAEADALANGPQSDYYLLAQRAKEASKQGSMTKAREASDLLRELGPKIERATELASDEALSSLADALEFADLGAGEALGRVKRELGALVDEIERIEARIAKLEILTTAEAMVAHSDAVKFAKAGGAQRLDALEPKLERWTQAHSDASALLLAAATAFEAAKRGMSTAAERARAFALQYASQSQDLQDAIMFESDGSALYMEKKDSLGSTLALARDALKPLLRVNFSRAQSYKDHEGDDDARLQELIGEASRAREKAAEESRRAIQEAEGLEGLLQAADRSAEALHELVQFLIEKRRAAAPYMQDLAQREGGAAPPEAHELYVRTELLRHRLSDWRSKDGPFDRALLTSLRAEIEDMDIEGRGGKARDAKRRADRARESFRSLRDLFVEKASNAESGAMSQAEIEAIQSANTIQQLRELVALGDRLRESLLQEHADFVQLQEAATTVESESIDTLTRLVDSCRTNLTIMNAVMARNPNARFFIETTVISGDDIRKLMLELRDGIEVRKRGAEAKTTLGRRDKDDSSIRADVRMALIERIFTNPVVKFRHVGMWNGETRSIQATFSEGQKGALQMMWLIKESEYHLECQIRRHVGGGSKKKLRNRSQRILFFDGLFSNLSDRTLIDEAFKGLGEADSNLQLIGLIHNPEYRNNFGIFPSLAIGRRTGWRTVEGERSFIRFDDGRSDGSMGIASFMVKKPVSPPHDESDHV